jgi:hypothetical protein
MTAGMNLTGNIIRFDNKTDDEVGGSVPTGTVIYSNVYGRISARKPTQALLEQGLEVPEIFTGVLSPGNINIRANDQYEVVSPVISNYYQKRFVIIGVQYSSMGDPRQYLIVTMRRFEIAHNNLLQ